jgi:hypothetical protein
MRFAILSMAVCLGMTAGARTHHKKSSASKTASTTHATAGTHHSRHGRSHASSARTPYQRTPTPQRYSEIQQALSKKGYYKGAANGVWGPDSADAMKRFQADQKLDGGGKLTARSLGALGLGSKHAVAQVTTPASSTPRVKPAPPADDPPQITPSGSSANDHRSPEGSQRP